MATATSSFETRIVIQPPIPVMIGGKKQKKGSEENRSFAESLRIVPGIMEQIGRWNAQHHPENELRIMVLGKDVESVERNIERAGFTRVTLPQLPAGVTADRAHVYAPTIVEGTSTERFRAWPSDEGRNIGRAVDLAKLRHRILAPKIVEAFLDTKFVANLESFDSPWWEEPYKQTPEGPIAPYKPFEAPSSGTLAERLARVNRRVRERPDEPISDFLMEVFPSLAELDEPKAQRKNIRSRRPIPALTPEMPPLPRKAPERWPSDPAKRKENPAQFATRVYRVWMDAEVFTRPALEKLDPLLLGSLDNWLKHNKRKAKPEPLPEGFNLLTVEQANDAWIERITSRRESAPTDVAGLTRLAMAMRYRGEKGR